MARLFPSRVHLAACVTGLFLLPVSFAWAIDIADVQMAALDQPQVNVLFRRTPDGAPLTADGWDGGTTICVQAYYDTGASGILLSNQTVDGLPAWNYDGLGVQRSLTTSGDPVTYSDVGVGGTQDFDVSEKLYVGLAPFGTNIDTENAANYTQNFGPVRTQISRPPATSPAFDYDIPGLPAYSLDVVGTPAMAGKVVVMDPKAVDNAINLLVEQSWESLDQDMQLHTYVYDPNTPYNQANALTNPGIPTTSHHIKLSYGDFTRFTEVTPDSEGPTLADNPFIGPNPVAKLQTNPPADNTPGIIVTLGGRSTTGSFLFDTGAAASMISSKLAFDLNVQYKDGTKNTDNPILEMLNPQTGNWEDLTNQFQLTVSGIGGDTKVAGFYLDSLLLPTMEGDPSDPNDPNNIRFLNAPVLVSDITLQDPTTLQTLTLDGIFGMNFLVASIEVIEGLDWPFGAASTGAFNWLVFDQPNGILGLDLRSQSVPEPATIVLLAIAALTLLVRRRARMMSR